MHGGAGISSQPTIAASNPSLQLFAGMTDWDSTVAEEA
jgi:hypothetical protein